MSGVSIGWFDTNLFHPRPSELAEAIRRHFRLKMQRPLNVDVLKYEGRAAGAAYTLLTNGSAIQICAGGIEGAPTPDVFTFVLEVSGRPALLSAPFKDETVNIWTGIAPPQAVAPLPLGMVELRAGMAVHFDPSANWHGYTSLPWDGAGRAPVPHAVLLQVGGYPAADIEGAIMHMSLILNADMRMSGSRL